MIHRFCVTHATPLLPRVWYDDCISLGEFQTDSAFHVKQLDEFWHGARPLAYGAAGSYVVPVAIERLPHNVQLVEISSYRKRVLPTPEGIEAPSYPTMRELGLQALDDRAELTVITPEDGVEFLVSQPRYFKKSILGQYAACHHRDDIVNYASIAVEAGVLNSDSASGFLSSHHFIPGGVELGIYPADWLAQALSGIERVSRIFLKRYSERIKTYDPYQIRAVGFLSERLGSYVLLRHLQKLFSGRIPAHIFGYMSVVVEEKAGYSIASTNAGSNGPGFFRLRQGRVR